MANTHQHDIRGLLILSSLTYLWVGLHFVNQQLQIVGELPTCIFRRLTGIPCGGCGMTTASILLLKGEIVAAFQTNPLGPLALMAATGIFVGALHDRIKHTNGFARWVEDFNKCLKQPRLYISLILLALAHWAWHIYSYLY